MEQTVTTLENVNIYVAGGFSPSRYDTKSVTITTGVKYAQYPNATRVEFVPKGKRKLHSFMVTNEHIQCVIVSTKHAVAVRDPFVETALMPGYVTKKTRYSSYDKRWWTELLEDLLSAQTPIEMSWNAGLDTVKA